MNSLTRKILTLGLGAGLLLTANAIAAPPAPEPTGAPLEARVELEATQREVPPEAAGFSCRSVPNCSTYGQITLFGTGDVTVTNDPDTGLTGGSGQLEEYVSSGIGNTLGRYVECRESPGNPFRSEGTFFDGTWGELFVKDVRGVPGSNALSVTLNPAGEDGESYPQENANYSEGGCGVARVSDTRYSTLWYGHFHYGHQDEWQEDGSLKFDGLNWDSARQAFVKTYQRPVTIGLGVLPYTVQEDTRIEVRPNYCMGPVSHVSSATAAGQSLGLDGMRFYPGQVITAPPNSKLSFADGSVIELDQGGSFRVDKCLEKKTEFSITRTVRKAYIEVLKALSGSEAKYNVKTQRAVAGVRGTGYEITYIEHKQLTKVAVDHGVVSLKGINGAKGEILIRKGQVGVQRGKQSPELVKR
jgi:hypothetical protein